VRIRTLPRAADILADPNKYDPRNKETADHSLPYVIAAALVDREVKPKHFAEGKILDPLIRSQLRKVEIISDSDIEKDFPEKQRTVVEILTGDGLRLVRHLDYPKGDWRNPLSDAELEQKFQTLAAETLAKPECNRVIDTVWKLDRLDTVASLTALI
jgi:2-methylcitrate dehydratase